VHATAVPHRAECAVRASQGKWADASEWAEYVERYHAVVTRALPLSSSAHVVVSATSVVPLASVRRTAIDPPVTAAAYRRLPLPSCAVQPRTTHELALKVSALGYEGAG